MATFGVYQPTAIQTPDYLGQFKRGYDVGKGIGDVYKRRQYTEAAAAVPEPSDQTEVVDPAAQTEQQRMLSEQTADMGIPDSAVEGRRTRRKRLTTEDWTNYTKTVLDAAAKTGDTKLLQEARENVQKEKHDGFMRYATQASAAYKNGDVQAAVDMLDKAYDYFPNNTRAELRATKDGFIEAVGYDEKTNEPKGTMVFSPEALDKQLMYMSDPMRYTQWDASHNIALKELNFKEQKAALEEGKTAAEIRRADATTQNYLAQAERNKALAANPRMAQNLSEATRSQGLMRVGEQRDKLIEQTLAYGGLAEMRASADPALQDMADRIEASLAWYDEEEQRLRSLQTDVERRAGGQTGSPGAPAPGAKFSNETGMWYAPDGRIFNKDGKPTGNTWK